VIYQFRGERGLSSELSKRILHCTECNELPNSKAATVRSFTKPCAQFDIYTNWKSERVSVAFIAEAPPRNSDGYFCDPEPCANYKETLRKALFESLELAGKSTSANLLASFMCLMFSYWGLLSRLPNCLISRYLIMRRCDHLNQLRSVLQFQIPKLSVSQ